MARFKVYSGDVKVDQNSSSYKYLGNFEDDSNTIALAITMNNGERMTLYIDWQLQEMWWDVESGREILVFIETLEGNIWEANGLFYALYTDLGVDSRNIREIRAYSITTDECYDIGFNETDVADVAPLLLHIYNGGVIGNEYGEIWQKVSQSVPVRYKINKSFKAMGS